MDGLQANLMAMKDPQAFETIFGILLRIGFLAKNLQLGKNVFVMQNYGAQRVKKLAHMQQAAKSVEIKKGQIALVKKQYKGKMELMKQHKDTIQSFYEKNKKMELDKFKPAEMALADVITKSKDTPLSYLKIEKMDDGRFKIGEEEPFVTSFFMLGENSHEISQGSDSTPGYQLQNVIGTQKDTNNEQAQVLCFKYGGGVLVFNEQFGVDLALKEIRGRIQKCMMTEQNGLSQESISEIKDNMRDCNMFVPYIK